MTTWDWYTIEQDVRLRHAADLRWAARARQADEARRASGAPGVPGPSRRLLDRLGGWLASWGGQLQALSQRDLRPRPEAEGQEALYAYRKVDPAHPS